MEERCGVNQRGILAKTVHDAQRIFNTTQTQNHSDQGERGGLTTLSELFNQVCEIVEVILVVVWGERTPGPPGQLRPALEVRGKEGEGPNISVEVI